MKKAIMRTTLLPLITMALLAACGEGPQQPAPKKDTVAATTDTVRYTCKEVVMFILESSPRYQAIIAELDSATKPNHMTYGTMWEATPNPEADEVPQHSDTYDINVHESYKQRMNVVARFSFDPAKRQLFEYDVVNDTLLPVSFDTTLLMKAEKKCW